MKKKSKAVIDFIDRLNFHITSNPQFRKDTSRKSEQFIQAEIRPLIISFLEIHFHNKGYKDYVAKANKSFYWEGQEGNYGNAREPVFAGRNYPDFIITDPYLIAIEYKQGRTGSLVKQAIGQSMMHTMSGQFDYVYILFHDENADKKIEKSVNGDIEKNIMNTCEKQFNVFLKFT